MSAARIVEAVDVLEDRHLSLPAGFPGIPPDQLGLDGLEESLDGGVIIAIAFSTHRHFEVMLAQYFLIIVRTILAATVGMMDAFFWRCPEGDSHLQGPDRKVTLHPITDRPANDTAGM